MNKENTITELLERLNIEIQNPKDSVHKIVLQTTIESNATNMLELDPGVSNRGLYCKYAYLHGWKIETTAQGTIIKTSCYDVDKDKGLQK